MAETVARPTTAAVVPEKAVAAALPSSGVSAAAPRPCAPGCEKHGVCNTELGRCDCAPYMGGDDCSKPLFSACAAAVGLTEATPAPCLYDENLAPVSCECLLECEALGLMGIRECYVMDSANATVSSWVKSQKHQRGLAPNAEYWQTVKASEAASLSQCSGHGIFVPPMPSEGLPPPRAASRCRCYAGFSGVHCERSITSRPRKMCLNSCSDRGECIRNWCHCNPGYFGVDCSLGRPASGVSEVPLPAPIGAQDSDAPRVYVYELPPRYNSWMHAGEHGWWQDFDLWGEDVIIHRRMLVSKYRVTDPELADYFFVPIWVSSAMWQMNWGFRDLLPTGVRTVRQATDYIRQTWPYFDRKGGADHIWVFGHDQGAWRVRAKLPLIEKGIFISPFGGGPRQRGGHLAAHDIVVPPVLYAHVPRGLMNHANRRPVDKPTLAFFQGKLNLHIPYEYSFGIRQGLYKAYRTRPETILVREGHEANKEVYFERMSGSKFCVAAAGFGFSTRAYEAAAAGCVPLIMQDGIEQAFEELLPWGLFSLRMNNSLAAVTTLDKKLAAIPEEAVRLLRTTLYCTWPRFMWLRHDPGAATPLPGAESLLRFDAFESVMWTLRKRLRKDINWPSDWQEGCRAVERYFSAPPDGVSGAWEPWKNYALDRDRLRGMLAS